jgi:hypothetical protein
VTTLVLPILRRMRQNEPAESDGGKTEAGLRAGENMNRF